MDIKAIIWDWRFVIIVLLVITVYAVFEWGKFKEGILSAMLMAKKKAKEMILNSGQEQEDWVVMKIYPCLPSVVKVVLSEVLFRKLIRCLYGKAKDYLDDGAMNNSNKIVGG